MKPSNLPQLITRTKRNMFHLRWMLILMAIVFMLSLVLGIMVWRTLIMEDRWRDVVLGSEALSAFSFSSDDAIAIVLSLNRIRIMVLMLFVVTIGIVVHLMGLAMVFSKYRQDRLLVYLAEMYGVGMSGENDGKGSSHTKERKMDEG